MAQPYEWNATVYHDVSRPQQAWGERVLDRLPLVGDETVIDAGCGTGRLTGRLLERLPHGRVICLDRSKRMLEVAREYLEPSFSGRVAYVHGDLTAVPMVEAVDVAFSTATFHWVLDHPRLFHELGTALVSGGLLVAQCGGGDNLARAHARADAVASGAAFADAFRGWSNPWEFADPATTARRLERAGFVDVETSLEEAPTLFSDAAAFRAFMANVVLRPYLARLGDQAARDAFVDAIVAASANDDPPFLLDYERLNIRARKP